MRRGAGRQRKHLNRVSLSSSLGQAAPATETLLCKDRLKMSAEKGSRFRAGSQSDGGAARLRAGRKLE